MVEMVGMVEMVELVVLVVYASLHNNKSPRSQAQPIPILVISSQLFVRYLPLNIYILLLDNL
jgi:hypothetical protein